MHELKENKSTWKNHKNPDLFHVSIKCFTTWKKKYNETFFLLTFREQRKMYQVLVKVVENRQCHSKKLIYLQKYDNKPNVNVWNINS